ncbi:M13 family metallopeptidase [Ramlibacter sp. MMS24-I3-19]|uniref:M13 family metallopeptidase n=1 Tax=Ramlibacter sp. MMS24-I3-19 TaxID=3416606 RepID=UPI003D000E0A
MLRTVLTAIALCAACAPVLADDAAPAAGKRSGLEAQDRDPAVRAQDDFFRHANGGWLATHAIPDDKSGWGVFNIVDEATRARVRGIVQATAASHPAAGSEAQKIADLYASYMDEAHIEALGLKPLAAEMDRVNALADKGGVPALIARWQQLSVSVPFHVEVHQDAKDATQYVVDLQQGGLGLPDRDYYLKDDDQRLVDIRARYLAHVQAMLAQAGDADAARSAREVLALETALARVQWTKVENRDPVKTYNRLPLRELATLTPGFDWQAWMAAHGIAGKADALVVSQPSYLAGFAKLLQDTPLATWKTYFRWHLLSDHAALLRKAFADERFAFYSTVLRGVPKQEPRDTRGIRLVERNLGEAVGKLYVAQYFPPEQKARVDRLVANMLAAFREGIDTLDWMDAQTKEQARLKLSTFYPKIGYPKVWRDYSALSIAPGDLVGNMMRVNTFESQRNMRKLGRPVDREEWFMAPHQINAYYNPELNEIVFPAAILQPPFFDPVADDAVNYGAIGSVIGHEISHGFDDQGSQYDEKGNLRNWWSARDHQQFRTRAAQLAKQYDAYSPVAGYFINGKLTLGENIADNSGLAVAYRAWQISLGGKPAQVIDGLTGEQRFFLGFAQSWRGKMRDQATIVQIKADPHSPNEFRVNGSVRNQDAFYRVFGVKPGDKLYLPPEQRVRLW